MTQSITQDNIFTKLNKMQRQIDELGRSSTLLDWKVDGSSIILDESTQSIIAIGSDAHIVLHQTVPAEVWVKEHGLGKYPAFTVIDSAGTEIQCGKSYPDENTVMATFASPTTGSLILN